ncbi:hypothetical protein ACLOAU_04085 [Niabella sp. CJ426]|uniref:hypothetical protein n=1 Tax=Niabella sp. CJ426 TaxID=3393740 RepID=UPI003CFDE643
MGNWKNIFKPSPPKLLTAQVKKATGELVEGYPFHAKNKLGQESYWMILKGTTVDDLTTGGMINLTPTEAKQLQPNFLKARAKSFVTDEWVEGFPFYAKSETEATSFWIIRAGCTIEEILTTGLVNIIPKTITYDR